MGDSFQNIDDLELKLIGIYYAPNQSMKQEEINKEFCDILAKRLFTTFSSIKDPNMSEEFIIAVNNGVLILSDKNKNLYAYWHKGKITKTSNVIYSPEHLISLPNVYKIWFKPGESLVIEKSVIPVYLNLYKSYELHDYLASNFQLGEPITVSFSGGVISGSFHGYGKNFIIVRNENNKKLVISDNLCIGDSTLFHPQCGNKVNQEIQNSQPINNEDEQYVRPLGKIKSMFEFTGIIETNDDEKRKIIFAVKDLLDKDLKVNDEVVYSEPKVYKGRLTTTLIHRPGSLSEFIQLASQYKFKKSKSQQILMLALSQFPESLRLIEALQHYNQDLYMSKLFSYHSKNKLKNEEQAIRDFTFFLNKRFKVKDCHKQLFELYISHYEENSDESIKSQYKEKCEKEIEQLLNDANFSFSDLQWCIEKYILLDDSEKALSLIDQSKFSDREYKYRLLYDKSIILKNKGQKKLSDSIALESLVLQPFKNKAENILWPEIEKDENLTTTINDEYEGNYINAIRTCEYLYNFQTEDIDDKGKVRDYVDLISTNSDISSKSNALLSCVTIFSKDIGKSTEYLCLFLSSLASNLFESNRASSVFLWHEYFNMVQGYGYPVRSCMYDIVTKFLDVAPNDHFFNWESILSVNRLDISILKELEYIVSGNSCVYKKLLGLLDDATIQQIQNDNCLDSNSEDFLDILKSGQIIFIIEYKAAELLNNTLYSNKNLSDLYYSLTKRTNMSSIYEGMQEIDLKNIEILHESILGNLDNYLREFIPEKPIAIFKLIIDNTKALTTKIVIQPTWFSVQCILKVLNTLSIKLTDNFDIATGYSKPQLSLSIPYNYKTVDVNDNKFDLHLVIKNGICSLPAENVYIKLTSLNINPIEQNCGTIKGGEKNEKIYTVELADDLKDSESLEILAEVSYRFGRKKINMPPIELPVYFNCGKQFNPIEYNVYKYGTELEPNDPTFFGRQSIIEQLVNDVMHPTREREQRIVYGQKRCGKSSLVKAVKARLDEEYKNRSFTVKFTISTASNAEVYSEAHFYKEIITNIKAELENHKNKFEKLPEMPDDSRILKTETPKDEFCKIIKGFKANMKKTPGWENRRIVLIIDEFTRIYQEIKKGHVSENIIFNWKTIQDSDSCFPTIFVGHDIYPQFFKEPYASNAAAIIEPRLLSYLDVADARLLIENPSWDVINKQSRFSPKAVDRIIYYTACNPYYLQIFMQNMIDYINKNMIVRASEHDVDKIANDFINKKYDCFDCIEKFDNLYNPGIDSSLNTIKDEDTIKVLRAIANGSQNLEWCDIRYIRRKVNKKNLDTILDDLEKRKVIERKNKGYQNRIIIELFKQWLLKN